MITASTAGAAETSLIDVVTVSRPVSGPDPGHAPGQLAQADPAMKGTDIAGTRRGTGISTETNQLPKIG